MSVDFTPLQYDFPQSLLPGRVFEGVLKTFFQETQDN